MHLSESIGWLFEPASQPQRLRSASFEEYLADFPNDVHKSIANAPAGDFKKELLSKVLEHNEFDFTGRGVWDIARIDQDARVALVSLHRSIGLLVLTEDCAGEPAGTIVGTENDGLFQNWRRKLDWQPRWPPSPPTTYFAKKAPMVA
eukprot:CAMPEP_0181328220 /NCGR_PEP_ID=MMETSP1101-20121128/22577_1 /TAXON_ID=46948 /ORGANISM="Rhodomonas abbreviata, Strain Caron Lab Isolate" /LENGTH=146 /DNA_ID=CAMNT_0023437049 /DNA_START=84 /DNA_END=524 /DNA_ORIENTATION=-